LPTAAPVPRGPSLLLLGSAAGLLDRPGCPACRYAAEASDAYLTWFALDGHYDADVLSLVCASRGMCPLHSRRLLSQPGAATRLTSVYRYVIEVAMRDLCARPARCPACEHDEAAADRVIDILLEDVMAEDRTAYEQHGGLCLPHLRRAASRSRAADLRWALRFMTKRLTRELPSLELLAGWPDHDAASRAALRAGLPARPTQNEPRTCSACWAAAIAEREKLSGTCSAGGRTPPSFPVDCLCERHLYDAAAAVDYSASVVLSWQAACHAARLNQILDTHPRRLGISVGRLSARSRRALASPDCPICQRRDAAGSHEVRRLQARLRPGRMWPGDESGLCVRHLNTLQALDAQAGRLAADRVSEYASQLVDELAAAFDMQTWARRGDPKGAEMTAWRRAAAFLDGAVLGGCPA